MLLGIVYLSTNARQQYAASTTSHARPVNLQTKTHPHLLPPVRTVSPILAELGLRNVVATMTKTQTVHATTNMTILPTPMVLEKASKRLASPARTPTKEYPRKRHPRRIET
jgi:hypothetical protein